MKGRRLALLLLPGLLLAGCGGTPQSRETGGALVVSVLGAEPARQGLRLYAAAERREGEGRQMSEGASPAQAVERLGCQGDQVVSCAHGEHILLSRQGAELLPQLLSYAFQDPQQSTETLLWVVRADSLAPVFAGEGDPARRMDVLKAAARDRQGFSPVTLRQAAGALAEGRPLLLPALSLRDGTLERTGGALWKAGRFTGWLSEEEVLGAALLLGQRVHWLEGPGDRAVSLRGAGCRLIPRWTGERLTGVEIRCRLEASRAGGWRTAEWDPAALERRTEELLRGGWRALGRAGGEGLPAGRAGLSRPWRWEALSRQWREAFPRLELRIRAEIAAESD